MDKGKSLAQNIVRRNVVTGNTRFTKREITERFTFPIRDASGQSATVTVPEDHVLLILMVGPRRCGKTSIVTSMINSFKTMETPDMYLEPIDLTEQYKNNQQELERFASLPFTKPGIAASYGVTSNEFLLYHEKHCSQAYLLRFIDVPGEWHDGEYQESMQVLFDEADVVMTAINTPAMIETDLIGQIPGVYDELINKTSQICSLLCRACDTSMYRKKLFLFVPVKCEKYYWNSIGGFGMPNMDFVAETVRAHYKKFFDQVMENEKFRQMFTIFITPILTVGGAVFSQFEPPTENRQVPTEIYVQRQNYNGYHPTFCEQPFLYILRFACERVDDNLRAQRLKSIVEDMKSQGVVQSMSHAFNSPLSQTLKQITSKANFESLTFPEDYYKAQLGGQTAKHFPQGIIEDNAHLGYVTICAPEKNAQTVI